MNYRVVGEAIMDRKLVPVVLIVTLTVALLFFTRVIAQECIPAPANGKGLAWDGQNFWVAVSVSGDGDLIQQVDPTTGQVGASFAAPGRFPSGLTFDGEHLWYADSFDDVLYQIDRATGNTVRTIPSRRRVTGITWNGKALWAYADAAALLLQLNPANGAILNVLRSPTQGGEGLAWDGQHLWLTSTLETFKIDPEDGDVFETVDEGSGRAVTFDGSALRLIEFLPDEICPLAIDTSAGVSVTIIPDGGGIALSQMFDLVLLVKTPEVSVTKILLTFDLLPVQAFPSDPMNPPSTEAPAFVQKLATCLVPGTVQSRPGQTFRCPGVSGQLLGVGLHVLRASVELSDGRTVRNAANWRVFGNSEP